MLLTRTLSRLQPWSLFLIRITVAVTMIFYGFQKIIPAGGLHRAHPLAGFYDFAVYIAHLGLYPWLAYVNILTEFLGGLLLLVGLLTRFIAFLLSIDMLFALVLIHVRHGYVASEYVLALLAMCLLLVTTGSGALALDRRFGLA